MLMLLVRHVDAENSFKRAMALGERPAAFSSPLISLLTCALAAVSITIFFNFNENILSLSFTDLIADYLLLNFLYSFGLLPRLFDIPDMRAVGFTVILGLISTSVLWVIRDLAFMTSEDQWKRATDAQDVI
jgi:hypothetical protein